MIRSNSRAYRDRCSWRANIAHRQTRFENRARHSLNSERDSREENSILHAHACVYRGRTCAFARRLMGNLNKYDIKAVLHLSSKRRVTGRADVLARIGKRKEKLPTRGISAGNATRVRCRDISSNGTRGGGRGRGEPRTAGADYARDFNRESRYQNARRSRQLSETPAAFPLAACSGLIPIQLIRSRSRVNVINTRSTAVKWKNRGRRGWSEFPHGTC